MVGTAHPTTMPSVTAGVSAANTANDAALTTGSFTPALNDLLIAFAIVSGQASGGTFTDSQGLGWTLVNSALKNSSADTLVCAVANALAANSSMTVTFTPAGSPTSTGVAISVLRVSGMTRTGAAAIRQSKAQDNTAGGGTPSILFDDVTVSTNPLLGGMANGANPAGVTAPSAIPVMTGQHDIGYATPATGVETCSKDSGYHGTQILWGSTSATDYGIVVVELDYAGGVLAGQGAIDVTGLAAMVQINAASGQGLVDVTPVTPTAVKSGAVLQQLVELTAVTPSAPFNGFVPAQAVAIHPPTPGVSRSWTSGEALPLELTAIAPTATLRAAAGLGAVDLASPGMTAVEGAAASGIGHLDFTPVAATTTKAAASGQGLVDLTPVAATGAKVALHEWGRVWFDLPAASVNFSGASGQGLIDVTGVAATGQHDASLVIGHWSFVIGSLAAGHAADCGPAIVELAAVAPASTKAAALVIGHSSFVIGQVTVTHAADLTPDSWLLAPVSPATTKSVTGLEVGLVDLSPVPATGAHGVDAGLGLVDLAGVSPDTTKAAGLGSCQWSVVSGQVVAGHAAALATGSWLLAPVAPTTPKQANDLAVASVELVGIAATRPYRKYAKRATLVRGGTASTLVRRQRSDL